MINTSPAPKAWNRAIFFDSVRPMFLGGKLTAAQVDGMSRVLDEWEKRQLTDKRWLAYMFATDFHETGQHMTPIREMGGEAYLRSKPYYPWVGEGLVQVTWKPNHLKFGATAPGQLLTWDKAIPALFDGMIKGMYTGRKLSDYFNDKRNDPIWARLIINGIPKGQKLPDRANDIAGYHSKFLAAIVAAS